MKSSCTSIGILAVAIFARSAQVVSPHKTEKDGTISGETNHPNNILLLVTDDQDIALGSFDHMPYVSQYLREQGSCFEGGGFVHTPVCCPSRSSILTGRYLHHGLGMAINNSIAGNCYGPVWKSAMEAHHTFAVHAQASGYTTAFCGKYLNQYHADGQDENATEASIPAGWDYWLGLEGNSRYYNTTLVEGKPARNANGSRTDVTFRRHGDNYPQDYLPLILQNYSLNLLRTLPEPWIMVVAWPTPHAPFTPEPWADGLHHTNHAPNDTPDYNASFSSQQQKHWLIRQLDPLSDQTAASIDQYYRMRLDALVTIDHHVHALMETLTSTQQLDHTLAIYTSDNGFQFGQHRLAIDKRHLYENDIRVPFCVRGPGIRANATISNKIVANVDIAPTILDVVLDGVASINRKEIGGKVDDNANSETVQLNQQRLRQAMANMSGLSFWPFVTGIGIDGASNTASANWQDANDPFATRHDVLISYHGEGFSPCGMAECPPPYSDIWWMPDAYNNTYNCVRTLTEKPTKVSSTTNGQDEGNGENSIYCRFQDDENFVEYYDLNTNPHQLSNDFLSLEEWQIQKYERRLQELLSEKEATEFL